MGSTEFSNNQNIENVSLFSNYYNVLPEKTISLKSWLMGLVVFKKHIEAYRACKYEEKRKKFKASLPCITPSGIFEKRGENYLNMHSGFLCIDIDGKDNPDTDWEAVKQWLGKEIPSLYYAGLSIGGDGIYGIFKIKHPDLHLGHFLALEQELSEKYDLTVDTNCRNISRLRGASYDSNPYFNERAVSYYKIISNQNEYGGRITTEEESKKARDLVRVIVKYIENEKLDMTDDYYIWRKLAYALSSEFGEEGIIPFRRISKFSPKFDEFDILWQYEKFWKNNKKITIRSFFYICKQFGVPVDEFKKRLD